MGSTHIQSLLELLLAEQFKIAKIVDLRIVQSLLQHVVDYEMPSIGFSIQKHLYTHSLNPAWHQFANDNERVELLDILLTRGGVVGERVLEEAVAQYGIRGLGSLVTRRTDFGTKAVRALARAASLNNFEAVEFFFQNGVDPYAFIALYGGSYSIQAVATGALYETKNDGCSLEMMQFLSRHGARLVVTPEGSTPFDFVEHLLWHSGSDTFDKIKYVLGTVMEGKTSSTLPADILELCLSRLSEDRMDTFEYLYRQGADVSPGSPLAALVKAGGREELVREVLYAGSDLNAYWNNDHGSGYTSLQVAAQNGDETLVRLFLREGANVNSPARGPAGFTALQAICEWHPATEEEHHRKMRICRLLIEHGANVNAPPAKQGHTALTFAAMTGDLEVASLLLREGANVNAPPGRHETLATTALDEAAGCGRLDMVKFLLNANALSADRGANGYNGAIFWAQIRRHSAVADLICEHAAKVEAGTIFNPELEKPQKDYRIYYELSTDDESSSDDDPESSSDDDYESSSEGDGEDMDAAGRTPGPTNAESRYRDTAQTEPDEQVVAESGASSYSDPGLVLPGENWPIDLWDEHIQPTDIQVPTGSWTGQVAANITAYDSASHSGMGFVLPEENWQMGWETEHIVADPSLS